MGREEEWDTERLLRGDGEGRRVLEMRMDHIRRVRPGKMNEEGLRQKGQFRPERLFLQIPVGQPGQPQHSAFCVQPFHRGTEPGLVSRAAEGAGDDVAAVDGLVGRKRLGRAEEIGDMPSGIRGYAVGDRTEGQTSPQGNVDDVHQQDPVFWSSPLQMSEVRPGAGMG